jgi:hypothetical protein
MLRQITELGDLTFNGFLIDQFFISMTPIDKALFMTTTPS